MAEIQSSLLTQLQPPDRRVLHELVLEQLLAGIRNGHIRAGERLLEVEIAERLGLSRGTVREAIRRLEQDGLVVTQPHRGTFVIHPGPRDVAESFSLRLLLESYAIRLAVPRATEQTLAELTATVETIITAAERSDQIDQLRCDQRLHEQLCLLSGHTQLAELWARLALKLWLVNTTLPQRERAAAQHRAASHHELIDLIRQGAADAASAWIAQHILERAREVLTAIAPPDELENLVAIVETAARCR